MSRLHPLGTFPLAGLLLGLAAGASAQEAPRLAIVGLHQAGLDAAAQEAAIDKIAEAVDVVGKADGLETDEVVRAIAGREEVILGDALLANGRTDLLNGKNLYNQAQTEDAIAALQSAVETLSVAVRSTNSVTELWEAWVYLGTAHLQSGNQEVGESCFRAAAALNPDRNPSPAIFPPDVIEVFEAQRGLLQRAAVTLEVSADGPAQVFLDGREIGPAPVKLTGVLPGMHHVLAKGEAAWGYQLLRVDQSETGAAPPASLTLGAPVIGTAAETPALRSRQIGGLYRAIGTHAAKIDLLLIAGVDEGQLYLQLYAPRADAFSKPVTAPITDSAGSLAAENIPALMDMMGTDGRFLPGQTHPIAIPVGLDTNAHLASLLMDPREPSTTGPTGPIITEPEKKKSPVVPIVVSVLIAGAAGTGGYFGYEALKSDEPRFGGQVVIGPLSRLP